MKINKIKKRATLTSKADAKVKVLSIYKNTNGSNLNDINYNKSTCICFRSDTLAHSETKHIQTNTFFIIEGIITHPNIAEGVKDYVKQGIDPAFGCGK